MKKSIKKISVMILIFSFVMSGLGGLVSPANAALLAVSTNALGAVTTSATTGYPLWYQDVTGTALQQCLGVNLDGTGAADPRCVLPGFATIPSITADPLGFPDESFYSFAEAPLTINGNAGRFRLLTEAAFASALPTNGQQITFARASLFTSQQGAFPANSTFHVVYPFGAFDFSTDALGDFVSIPGSGPFAANAKEMRAEDGPGAAGDFTTILAGTNTGITTFLRSTTPPAGYLGDAVTETPVTGGTNGNIVTITQTAGVGPFVVTGGTNWVVAGKIAVIDTVAPVITAAPMSAALGTAGAFATATVTDDQFVSNVSIDLSTLGNTFTANLTGAQEVPAVATTATGSGTFTIDRTANTLTINTLNGTGFVGGAVTGVHIHGSVTPGLQGAPGVNSPIVFDFASDFTLPKTNVVWNYPEAMEPEILAGRTYVNIHTTAPGFTTGEIRGQILPVSNIQNMVTATPSPRTNAIWSVALPTLNQLGIFTLPITATDGSNTASANLTLTVNQLTSVSVAPATATIVGAATQQLTASPLDNNGAPFVGATVTWSSSNPAAATVDANGLVTGVLSQTPASAIITATAVSGATTVTGTSSISVSPGLPALTTVNVTPNPASIVVNAAAPAGVTLQLAAATLDQFSVPFVGATVTWSSNNTAVATVNAATGLVTSVTPGTATITATASDGAVIPTTVTGTTVVTITTAPQVFTSVSVTPATATLTGGTQQLTATALDQFGGPMAPQPAFTFTSSNPAVASVSATGLVTAVTAGTATITATSGVLSGTSAITVNAVTTSLGVTPNPSTVVLNATLQLTATALDQFGTAIAPTPAVTWTSSAPLTASVDANGLVTGVALGTATITAADTATGLITGASNITVVAVPQVLTSVSITPATASIITGATQQFTASALDQFGSTMIPQPAITFSSSNPAVATVNATGLVSGVTPGTSTITATSGALSGTAALTVTLSPAVLTTVSLTPATSTIAVGATGQLTASLLDQRNDPFTSLASTTFVSSNPLVATVNANGLVTGVAAGTATITATNGLITDTAIVNIAVAVASDGLQALVAGPSGVFTIPALTPATSTPSVTISLPLMINIAAAGATSTVDIPSGTVITKTDGTNLDATALSANAVAAGALTNLGDVTVNGSVQWGIPNIGLQFSQPITLSIFVGTALNGQTINIVRSVSGDGGWTSDGIVAPATSLVVNGFATFQATKASFYAATTPNPVVVPVTPAAGGGGGGGGGGGFLPPAQFQTTAATVTVDPAVQAQIDRQLEIEREFRLRIQGGQVLGERIDFRQAQLSQILSEAELVSGKDLVSLLANAIATRQASKEAEVRVKFVAKLKTNLRGLSQDAESAIANFIAYGTANTKKLGEGERAGVLDSYKAAYGKLPTTKAEWQDALKIAIGRFPGQASATAETKAKAEFKKIYKRDASMSNEKDKAAVNVMAYGLRPDNRNTNSEKAAINSFRAIFKKGPSSATDWDKVRAIAYSGAKR